MINEPVEMIKIGENEKGEDLFNLQYVKGGKSLPTPSMTKAEAFAMINGTEVKKPIVKPVAIIKETTVEISDYKKMTKKELEVFMRKHGIELDRRKSKNDLLLKVENFLKD